MAFGDADLSMVFTGPLARDARWGVRTTRVFVDDESAAFTDSAGQLVNVQQTTLRLPSAVLADGGVWAGLAEGEVVVVGTDRMRVRDVNREGDGAVTALVVTRL